MLSKDNKHVKLALKLKQKKFREQEGLFTVEGIRFIEEAIKSSTLKYILYSNKVYSTSGWERILEVENIASFEVSDDIIKELCDTENPQGAVAIVEKTDYSFDDVKNDYIVILDRIQDPGNMGTIIRTCDAAGVGGIVVTKGSVDIYNSKVLRATMGSVFHVPILYFDSLNEVCEALKPIGYNIYGTSPSAKKYMYDCDFVDKTAIVIGNEARGIDEEDLRLMDELIKIPMMGDSESLNAAIASGVVIYEVVRQRLTTNFDML